ncbi:MAG: HAMP domain-containing histidine kinase [Candidatus Nanopelagicaceae bacterium]|nr:HAMP domain-containing histidine kinase [Candidatus Nanopelagicaceae bacterium]
MLVPGYFRRSLFWRVFIVSGLISIAIIYLLGSNLYGRVSDGIIDEKINASISEAESAIQYADYRFIVSGISSTNDYKALISEIVSSSNLTAKDSGREVALLQSADKEIRGIPPVSTSNFLEPSSIPSSFREKVRADDQIHWQKTTLIYVNGEILNGVVIGRQLTLPRVGKYEMYVLFGFDAQQRTIDLIGRSMWGTGILLIALIMIVASVVLRQVIRPVKYAAEVAEQLTSGDLSKRMEVKGEDEVARLGQAFNEMGDTLEQQISRLENLSRLQQRFVSDVSHELRTPLTTIRMASDVIHSAKDGFDPNISRSAELLISQIDRFENLLSDLLEVSRFDAQVATLSLDQIDASALVRRCVDDLEIASKERATQFHLSCPEQPVLIEADSRRLERIMRNLLANAIDHSEGKPIHLTVKENGAAVSISVRDYGVGLTESQIERVFDRFWRADPSRSRERGGTGLGLAIAKEDAMLHGGVIKVWGELGKGANFVLTLPKFSGSVFTEFPLSEIPTK